MGTDLRGPATRQIKQGSWTRHTEDLCPASSSSKRKQGKKALHVLLF